MRTTRTANHPILRHVAIWFAVLFALAITSRAHADDRSDARTHYQSGVKFYGGGDYRSAIREFSAAQQLAPADLNNYNLALCYDKLGEAEPAIQYYHAYLDKNPSTDKRAEIEASMARLDGAAKSAAAKKAEEARRAEEAQAALDAKRADDARKAEEGARRAEDARRAQEAADAARRAPPPPLGRDPNAGVVGGVTGPGVGVGVGASGVGTPGSGATATTGDAQLDRVQQIDINQVRDQRMGGNAAGRTPDPRVAPTAGGPNGTGGTSGALPPNGNSMRPGSVATADMPNGPTGSPNGSPALGATDQPKPDPVYKKWWFWAVVGVSAYVVYSIATENSSSSTKTGRELPLGNRGATPPPGGLTLMSW